MPLRSPSFSVIASPSFSLTLPQALPSCVTVPANVPTFAAAEPPSRSSTTSKAAPDFKLSTLRVATSGTSSPSSPRNPLRVLDRLTNDDSSEPPVALESSTAAAVSFSAWSAPTPRLIASAWLAMIASSLNVVVASRAAAWSWSACETPAACVPRLASDWSSEATAFS